MRLLEIAPGCQIEVDDAIAWNGRDRAAWYWPEPIRAADWPEKYRWLEEDEADRVGPWRNRNAPYLKGIMNLSDTRGIARNAVKKAVQLGVSDAARNLCGKWAHFDPSPIGLALPNEQKGREIVENKVMPFFKRNFARHEELRQLLSANAHDMKKGQIKLNNGFVMHLMWAGSPASLASNPMKRAISDEVNKFVAWSGNDADPISLVDKRLRTYADSFHLLISSPTQAGEGISAEFEAADTKLYCLVPCPHCGTRQRLVWEQVKIPKEAHKAEDRVAAAATLIRSGECWYECAECKQRWEERQKRRAVAECRWGTVGEDELTSNADEGGIADAEAVEANGGWPSGTRLGMQLGAFYAMWESCTLSHIAAEWMRARGNPAKMFDWRTGTCGEDFEQIQERMSAGDIKARSEEGILPEAVVPWWGARLIAVIDTQKDHFWVVIRAWGPGMRSCRVWHGRVESFADLDRLCFHTPWKNEDSRVPARSCDLVLIDSGGTRKATDKAQAQEGEDSLDADGGGGGVGKELGVSRTMEVYRWALDRQALVRAIKGDAHPRKGEYIRRGRGMYVTEREKKPLPLWLLDVHHFQDELVDLMAMREGRGDAVGEEEVFIEGTGEVKKAEGGGEEHGAALWQLNQRDDSEYNRHMGNMVKVSTGQGQQQAFRWKKVGAGARVDYRACEGYQVAAAYLAGVNALPDLMQFKAYLEAELATKAMPAPPAEGFRTPGGQTFVASQR